MADHRDTLMLPFEKGLLGWPQPGQDWAVLNADVLPDGGQDNVCNLRQSLSCEQGFRPQYLALKAAGFRVSPGLDNLNNLHGCLVLASRSRLVNERNMQRAWNALSDGGHVVFAGDKKSGAQAIRKWIAGRTEVAGSLSKHHAIVFWANRHGGDWPMEEPVAESAGYRISPGMFSADGPDPGSQMLAQHFDNRLSGRVADFGAGWGYLASQLQKNCLRIERLELYEADWASLEAAKLNVGEKAACHWVDLTAEAPRGPFDWIVMNPPFHEGRAAMPELGLGFIKAAARALPAGGRLLMVANTRLPYENTLQELFRKVEIRASSSGFKVVEAVKGSR